MMNRVGFFVIDSNFDQFNNLFNALSAQNKLERVMEKQRKKKMFHILKNTSKERFKFVMQRIQFLNFLQLLFNMELEM